MEALKENVGKQLRRESPDIQKNKKVISVCKIELSVVKKNSFYQSTKRAIDFAFALTAVVLLLPLFLIISVLIYIDDPGPILYGHTRIGVDGKPFKMWKFRSMCINADELIETLSKEQKKQYETEFKIENDPRITRVGSFLRKSSMDELPQLFNVLFNEMSLVGPRPLISRELDKYYADNKELLLSVKPGITGFWQAYARNDVTYESGVRQQMEMYYVRNASIFFDCKILLKTIVTVLRKKGVK